MKSIEALIWLPDGSYNVVGILLAVVGTYLLVDKLLHFDTWVEGRRQAAKTTEAWLNKMGMTLLGAAFGAYSVGDYSGFWAAVKAFCKAIANTEGRRGVLRVVLAKQIELARTDDAHRKLLDEVSAEQGVKIEITKVDTAAPTAVS
jgi:hypothetical protein